MHFSDRDGDYWEQLPESRRHNRENARKLGFKLNAFAMADSDDPDAPLVSMLFIPPGRTLPRHRHDCHRVEVIVKGSLQVGDRILQPGDLSRSSPGEAYGPHVAGPDGCLSVEIFSRSSGMDSDLSSVD